MNRTTQGLRTMLFDELDRFMSGTVDSDHVKAVCRLNGAILATVSKDIEATKLLAVLRNGADAPKAVADLNLNLMLSKGSDDH